MNPESTNNSENKTVAQAPAAPVAPSAAPAGAAPVENRDRDFRGFRGSERGAGPRGGARGPRKGDTRAPRAKPEFDSVMLNIRRVSRTVSGGRRFSFSVALVAGDRKGKVGVGLGKAGDTALAIDKATRHAKKNMVQVNATKEMSIPHEVSAKYASARVTVRPVKDRGLVAGSSARTVLELAGLKNVAAKIISPSKNKLNIARATIEALGNLNLIKPTRAAK
ncbi:MAG TPA: 30S ribosomal protein S5 [Candidatus Paceibacterota bacterium]|nr:30S ribosomal protein S5 [Candidatus Paceibacterota bacterium]